MSCFEKYLLFSVVSKITYWELEREERKIVKAIGNIYYIIATVASGICFVGAIGEICEIIVRLLA